MKKKYGKDDSFTMQEWCKLNYAFYERLFVGQGCESGEDYGVTMEKLIDNYYCNCGVILDRDFVIDMLECLPSSCAYGYDGKWNVSISSVSCFSQN